MRADIRETAVKKNAEDALSWLETTETALMQIKEVLQRARNWRFRAPTASRVPEDCQKIAEEVVQLRDQLVSLGNSTYAGKHIFAGYKTNQAPVGLNPDGSLNYAGDLGQIMYQVGVSDILQGNMTAREIFEPGGKDLFADMQDFIDALNIGNSGTVGGIIGDIDVHMENILAELAEAGAKVNRMKLVVNRLEDDCLDSTNCLSQMRTADMAR